MRPDDEGAGGAQTYEEDPGLFFLRADNSRRTQMSGQALFSGLYPTSPLSPGNTRVFPFYTRDEGACGRLPARPRPHAHLHSLGRASLACRGG